MFVPFLNKQQLGFGCGELLSFDLSRVESDIRDALLPSAQPIAIVIRDFKFKNELKETGALERMATRIKQENLPAAMLEQVCHVDTFYHEKKYF